MAKVIFNSKKINWFNTNQKEMKQGFLSIGIKPYLIDEDYYLSYFADVHLESVDIDEVYQGISLYDLTIYNICNDLIIFKDELNLNINSHKEVTLKWYSIAKVIIKDIKNIFNKDIFNLVLVINGHSLLDACLMTLAKEYNFPFLCIENTSNRKRIVWDDISGKVVTYNLSKDFYNNYKAKINEKKVKTYIANFKNSIFDLKKEEHLSNLTNSQVPFDKPYVLFLAQVYCDAAQLFAINEGFKNPIEIIENTIDICKNLNLPIVVKLHPKEIEGTSPVVDKVYGSPTYKRIKKRKSDSVVIDYLNNYNTYKLIEKSQIVITVNSQAGLEACLYDKPVLSYKDCFFSGLGFTYDYQDSKSLKNGFDKIIKRNINKNRSLHSAQNFFYIFFEKYCIKNSMSNLLKKVINSGVFNKQVIFKFELLRSKKRLKNTVKKFLLNK